MEQQNQVKKALFSLEIAQAGVALTQQELDIVFTAALKLEGFSDEDFKQQGNGISEYINAAKKSVAMIVKRRQIIESLTFQLLTKDSVNELDKRDDLIEYVGKVKRIAAMMADEFMEPDERLEKVAEDGRRLIENFIDQWKTIRIEELQKQQCSVEEV